MKREMTEDAGEKDPAPGAEDDVAAYLHTAETGNVNLFI